METLKFIDGGLIDIGNNVSINKNSSIVSRNKIRIGNNVSIGPNCVFMITTMIFLTKIN